MCYSFLWYDKKCTGCWNGNESSAPEETPYRGENFFTIFVL